MRGNKNSRIRDPLGRVVADVRGVLALEVVRRELMEAHRSQRCERHL